MVTPDLAQWRGRPAWATQLPIVGLSFILGLSSSRCSLQLLTEGPMFGQLGNLGRVSPGKEGNIRKFLISLLKFFFYEK